MISRLLGADFPKDKWVTSLLTRINEVIDWTRKAENNPTNTTVNTTNTIDLPAGIIAPFAGDTAPDKWCECDGREKSKTAYATLYAAIGDTWNTATDPTTGSAHAAPSTGNFRVPDLRGVFLRGAGTANGLDEVTLGGYQTDGVKDHTHKVVLPNNTTPGWSYSGNNWPFGVGSATTDLLNNGGVEYFAADGHGGMGSGSTLDTRPINIGVNYIIKL